MPGVDIKKDDNVRVMTGKDRGKTGRVVRVQPRRGRVMVDGVALAKKHQRASGNRDHGEPAYDLSALLDPMVTVSRCLDPVCSLALPLVKAVAPAGERASPGSST